MKEFNDNAVGALEFTITWESDGVTCEEWFLGRRFNPVNDVFPQGMREGLEGKREGESVTLSYEPRRCIPRFKENLVETMSRDRLRPKTRHGEPIIPRLGRFYPQGHINGLLDVYPDTLTPFRLTGLDETSFTADRNHPLALIPVTISARIQSLEARGTGTYGSLTHWREKTCDWGPGMQARLNGEATDFFHPAFFERRVGDETPFTLPAPDQAALRNIDRICARFIEDGMRVLDFSPGSDRPEGKYDAAVCSCCVEYMDRPVDVLRYVSHFLSPGAPMLIAFSNRPAPDRAIRGWLELHEFERMGLCLDYLRMACLDQSMGTISIRNDWRDREDPRFLETRGVSDPVYVVYGLKR